MARKRKKNDFWQVFLEQHIAFEITGVLFILLGALALLSLLGMGGIVGRSLNSILLQGFGIGSFVVAIGLIGIGIGLLVPEEEITTKNPSKKPARIVGGILAILALVGLSHLPFPVSDGRADYLLALSGKGGGAIGFFLSYPLRQLFGLPGAVLLLGAFAIVGAQMATGLSWGALFALIKDYIDTKVAEADEVEEQPKRKSRKQLLLEESEDVVEGEIVEKEVVQETELKSKKGKKDVLQITSMNTERKKGSAGKGEFHPIDSGTNDWKLPPFDLLDEPSGTKIDFGDPKEKASIIEDTLRSFGLEAKVVEANLGPTITQYALKPARGVRVSKILTLHNDLALALSAPSVRIEAPIPSRPFVGIEVPNEKKIVVKLRELLETEDFINAAKESKINVALGRDVSGKPLIARLDKMPHLLIAGATGSGKSVCSNAIICSLLYQATPHDLKFIMVDPKRVELTAYNGIPHLLSPVINDPHKTISALKWALKEMDRRYRLLAEESVRNIGGYNKKHKEEEMPYIVIVIEELADLMMVSPVEVETCIVRLAQMARAVGIHLIISTQRPSVDVLTGLIKANIPARVAFNVSSQIDSRVVLDAPGAERLLGQGDMLYLPSDQPKAKRSQGAFVSDSEVMRIVSFLKNQGEPEFAEEVLTQPVEVKTGNSGGGGMVDENEYGDVLFLDALQVMVDNQGASTSLLQRKLRVGYSRAARLIDMMAEQGLIGSATPGSSKQREVHMAQALQVLRGGKPGEFVEDEENDEDLYEEDSEVL